jgi:LysM domain
MHRHSQALWMSALAIAVFLLAAAMVLPAQAGSLYQQAEFTSTPLPDGRIFHVVGSGESCISIANLYGIPVDTLRQLNNLTADSCGYLQPGQKLLIGMSSNATAVPTLNTTPSTPTPTPAPVKAEVCIVLFADINGNALADTDEGPVANGVVSMTDRTGQVSLTGKTTAELDSTGAITNSLCFENVPAGDYNVSLAIPSGYNATTSMNYALRVTSTEQYILDFGAQLNSLSLPVTTSEGGTSPLLGLAGGILLLAGIGLAVYQYFSKK